MRLLMLRLLAAAGSLLVLALVGWIGLQWWDSRLPSSYDAMAFATPDYGGGPRPTAAPPMHHGVSSPMHGPIDERTVSVAALTEPRGVPDERFTLTAHAAAIHLPSGRTIDALTFNGTVPGPELRVREGDLVEVTLVNRDIASGVSIHWHGVDVPNAEDGVAGVTQDAVPPGGRFVYRFRPSRAGTFWYHAHQASANEVRRGLYGAFVVEPRSQAGERILDLALASHDLDGTQLLAGSDRVERRSVAPGRPVHRRLINTGNLPQRFLVDGTAFRVLAIDGNDVNAPAPLAHRTLRVAAGGRYDIGFTMPARAVLLSLPDTNVGLVLSGNGTGDVTPAQPGPDFDPIAYGAPARQPFDAHSHFDRRFRFSIGRKPGFLNGRPGMQWTINGGIFPRVPMFMVSLGDLVEVTIENHTKAVHPMHLHGHRMLVLSRDGVAPSGSAWWTDTLDVEPGQRYELAFRADNPGIWMDHCHNLRHAGEGLTMHLAYEGVVTPYRVGGTAHNHPE
jgi:FtsP/CotA-like multicopper oxidase with cupredoxin domain